MNTFIKYSLITVVLFLMAACKEKSNRPVEMPAPSISVALPEVRNITLTKDYPGYLSSELMVNLVARVNGYLQTSYLKPGQKVKKGDLIYVIEPDLYIDNVQQAEAAVNTAKAQLQYARSNYERMKEAAKSGAVSQIQVLQAEATVSEAEASVKNSEAELNTAQKNLSYCYVRAPFDGKVTRGKYDIGNYINGSLQPVTLATLYKDDLMYANFNIEDNQFMKMLMQNAQNNHEEVRLPKEVTVHLGKDGKQSYTGRLDYLSPNVDLSTGTLNVRANLDNKEGTLKSGLYVTITLPYAEEKQAILVQDASIGTDQLGKYLYVVNDSNVVKYRHIEPGQLIDDTLRQVISGIKPNERYVTTALLKVRDGMTIKPIK
ncbi:efflux RND transporter periplasmic adaptor subunit [Parabacteroides bouchesdurhonensis]|uniref:efflux RND transporter periplasmic adaptor subunit n=1 Tax=Parabacteroides bouchesdurhonensis TaxID=1936995 RepID=UPI000C847AED|nr:efflux RND transporter periplasmic adaptor subunit [Parabacteroides bouchesdurhonensis]RHJ90662.1 efflux RND transporter periplasmic adaptor subunit [Bacteroides sp. AM07-16]